ncbi:MAG: hypothetical protein M2R45_01347 [Verrucomicrobia subdivision 3 bacterium]|nr:hypothetical protein [Limisphaerales bacterium]MCS1416034.1 hypothetical protein [Limisphaerales bacterium]
MLSGQPGRSVTCLQCRADLRVCLNCEHFDEHAAYQCRERRAEPVMEKDRANFCEYFEMVLRTFGGTKKVPDAADKLRKLLGD